MATSCGMISGNMCNDHAGIHCVEDDWENDSGKDDGLSDRQVLRGTQRSAKAPPNSITVPQAKQLVQSVECYSTSPLLLVHQHDL
jgi:hypothetical protein